MTKRLSLSLAPSGPPENVVIADTMRDQLIFNYVPPPCEKANGEITQYEYQLKGLDEWVKVKKALVC